MTTNVTLAEEMEALLLEGKAPLPAELDEIKAEYDDLNDQIAKLEARKTEIKIHAALVADSMNVSMFTVDGVNAFGYNDTTRTNVDTAKLRAEFPEIAKVVITSKKSKSFYSRKI